jgi:L-gulonate 5-dehydrogenase
VFRTKSLVLREPFNAVVEEVPMPQPGPGEALVQVKCVGVCGTDIRSWQGRHSFTSYPRVPGHEVSGIVVEFGSQTESRGIALGDPVVIEPMIACGKCYSCSIGRYNCCENLEVLGVHRDGAMQEYLCVPASLLHKAPPGSNFVGLSFVEPACVGLHAINRSRASAGDTVAVIGAGNIGLLMIQILKAKGANVIAIDVKDSRLNLARRLGADLVINSQRDDPVKEAKEFTGGTGVPVVFEAVGVAETVLLTFELVSYAGQIVLVGVCPDEVRLRPDFLNKRELDVLASRNSKGAFPGVLDLVREGKLVTEELVSRRITIGEFNETMREVTSANRDEVKIVVDVSDRQV